jgi:hypothetical protein
MSTRRHHLDRRLGFRHRVFRQTERERQLIEILFILHPVEKLRLRLRHHHMLDLLGRATQLDRKQSDIALVQQTGHRASQRHQPQLRQEIKCPDHRMAGKGQLLRRREDPQPDHRRLVGRRKHEDRLGEVHLPGDLLELIVGEPVGIGKHGNGITAERLGGKHIGLIELQRAAIRHS